MAGFIDFLNSSDMNAKKKVSNPIPLLARRCFQTFYDSEIVSKIFQTYKIKSTFLLKNRRKYFNVLPNSFVIMHKRKNHDPHNVGDDAKVSLESKHKKQKKYDEASLIRRQEQQSTIFLVSGLLEKIGKDRKDVINEVTKQNWLQDYATSTFSCQDCHEDPIFDSCTKSKKDGFRWVDSKILHIMREDNDGEVEDHQEPSEILVQPEIKKEMEYGLNILSMVPDKFKKKRKTKDVAVKVESNVREKETKKTILRWFDQRYNESYVLYAKEMGFASRVYTVATPDHYISTFITNLISKGKRSENGAWFHTTLVKMDKDHVFHEHTERSSKCRCFLDFDLKLQESKIEAGDDGDLFKRDLIKNIYALLDYIKNALIELASQHVPPESNDFITNVASVVMSVYDASNNRKISKHAIFKTNDDTLMFDSKHDVGLFVSKCVMDWAFDSLKKPCRSIEDCRYVCEQLRIVISSVDFGIYEKSGEFRLPLCTKITEHRPLIPERYDVCFRGNLLACEYCQSSHKQPISMTCSLKGIDHTVHSSDSSNPYGIYTEYHIETKKDEKFEDIKYMSSEFFDSFMMFQILKLLDDEDIVQVTVKRFYEDRTERVFTSNNDDMQQDVHCMHKYPSVSEIWAKPTSFDKKFDMTIVPKNKHELDNLHRRLRHRSSGPYIYLEDLLKDSMISPMVSYDKYRYLSKSGTALITSERGACLRYFKQCDLIINTIKDRSSMPTEQEDGAFRDDVDDDDVVVNILLRRDAITAAKLCKTLSMVSAAPSRCKKFFKTSNYVDTISNFVKQFEETKRNTTSGSGVFNIYLHSNVLCGSDIQSVSENVTQTSSSSSLVHVNTMGGQSMASKMICNPEFKDWLLDNISIIDSRFSIFLQTFFLKYDPLSIQEELRKLLIHDIYSEISQYSTHVSLSGITWYKDCDSFDVHKSAGRQKELNKEDIYRLMREKMLLDVDPQSISISDDHGTIRIDDDRQLSSNMLFKVKSFKYCPIKRRRCNIFEHSKNNSFIVADIVKKRFKISCSNVECVEWLSTRFEERKNLREQINEGVNVPERDICDMEEFNAYLNSHVYFKMSQKSAELADVFAKFSECIFKLNDYHQKNQH